MTDKERVAAVNAYLMTTHLGYADCTDHAREIVRILDARAPLTYDPAKCGGLFDRCAYADLHVAPCEGCAAAWAVVLQGSKP